VSKGKLIGIKYLEVDLSESKTNAIGSENPEEDQKEGRMEFLVQANQMRGPEGLGDEIDPMEKRGKSGTGVTH